MAITAFPDDYVTLHDQKFPVRWMAPEVLSKLEAGCDRYSVWNTQGSVWSLAMVLWEISVFCEERPFDTISDHGVLQTAIDHPEELITKLGKTRLQVSK